MLLEKQFPFLWVAGEVSNFHRPASGHFYFTLKDKNSQIKAVMFRGQNRNLTFELEDGLQVTGMCRISVYEPRGIYQIIFEYLEPKGIGALQVAFEQLKSRLAAEGLFEPIHKKKLPFLPQHVSLITSPTGAVVHDMLQILNRRFPNMDIEIIPVTVQGSGADKDIVTAVEIVNRRAKADVAILARGGGSLEDLQAFNSEVVARAIFESAVPIISAVGHETDFTIADFVADFRAPTPSAAAELVVPLKDELGHRIQAYRSDLLTGFNRYIAGLRLFLSDASARLVDPKRKVYDFRLRIDDDMIRLNRLILNLISRSHERFVWRNERLFKTSPLNDINFLYKTLNENIYKLLKINKLYYNNKRFIVKELTSKLGALNPKAILERGYSITRTIPDAAVVRDARYVSPEQKLEVLLAKGSITCRVKRIFEDGKKNLRTGHEAT